MGRIPMYVPGKRVKSLNELDVAIRRNKWIYWNGVPKSPKWIANMSLQVVQNRIVDGEVFVANKNPRYKG